MVLDPAAFSSLRCSIAPWLSVRNSAQAVDFYKAAFGATEVYRLDAGGGVVAKLSVVGGLTASLATTEHHGGFKGVAHGTRVDSMNEPPRLHLMHQRHCVRRSDSV